MEKITTKAVQPFETEHYAALRKLAPECMVLLKKNGDFPLAAPGKVALYGSGARRTVKGGTGSGDVNVRSYTTVEQGLKNAGFEITTAAWLDAYDGAREAENARFYAKLMEQAKDGVGAFMAAFGKIPDEPRYDFPIDGEGDTCLYVLSRNSGEGSDRSNIQGDFRLTDDETRDILRCAKQYAKMMLVLNVGGPVDISPVNDAVPNILILSQLGSVTGDAFADVLLGKAYPSGKLTSTWAKADDYCKLGDFAELEDSRYKEGIFVGYRYFDAAGISPVYPFGYGLSYTEFSIRAVDSAIESGVISVKVRVENVGRLPGKEIVQLFYSAPQGRLIRPVRELGAFGKTAELAPGASETLTLQLPAENMAGWDTEASAWVLEKGTYLLSVGTEPVCAVELGENVVTQELKHVDGAPDFEDWAPAVTSPAVPAGIPVLSACPKCLNHAGHYDRLRIAGEKLPVPDMSGFTDDDLAHVCAGKFLPGATSMFIGATSYSVAGSAAETADVVEQKGYGRLVFADGPAGVRITPEYVDTPEGALELGANSLSDLMAMIGGDMAAGMEAAKKKAEAAAEKYGAAYHYSSAIPIGTALAQAWNPTVPEACGALVGDEMERFGVNVWLAPAMNIHRSPLCGRNFEYYSEDPLVAGRTAAGMTRGVQSHDKCAVTIKHFACNSQETNRFGSNSILSERAMREIYLKNFEICVKESAPRAVMSSYNLVNGVHTANRRDLQTQILREEWGFEGIVMTDWGTTGEGFAAGRYHCSSAALCVRAGNDMTMPGTQPDVDDMLARLGKDITRADLETCAGRVLAMSKRLS